jgi:hypothetical protein
MKTIYSILAFLILTTTSGFAQGKAVQKLVDNVNELKQRPLKVVLLTEGKKANDNFNENIKAAIESEWNFINDFSFISIEEFKAYRKEKNSEFTFLIYVDKKTSDISFSTDGTTKTKTTTVYSNDIIGLVGFNDEGKRLQTLPQDICFDDDCAKAEYYFAIQKFNSDLKVLSNYEAPKKKIKMKDARAMLAKYEEDQKKGKQILENKTLYVHEKSMNKNLIENFKNYYTYNYKVVTKEDIQKAITDNNEDVVLLESNQIRSADTGETILSFIDMKKMRSVQVNTKTTSFIDAFGNEISKSDLERLKKVLN